MSAKKLSANKLYLYCEDLGFNDTSELNELSEILGHNRAIEALEFGLGIKKKGYNLFVFGSPGLGKHSVVSNFIKKISIKKSIPQDWCYVQNFSKPTHPLAIALPPGRGKKFEKDMDHFIDEVKSYLPAIFESENYNETKKAMVKDLKNKQKEEFNKIQKEAEENHTTVVKTSLGFAVSPISGNHVLTQDEFDLLPEAEKDRLDKKLKKMEKKLKIFLDDVPKWEKELVEKIRSLERKMIKNVVQDLINRLQKEYASFPRIVSFLEEVEKDIILHARDFLLAKNPIDPRLEELLPEDQKSFEQYKVNVLIDNKECKGAPVIYLDDPSFQNLVGRIEHSSKMGTLITNFNLIRKGAFHEANGGYLIIDARKVFENPRSWEAIKRVIRSGQINITSLGQEFSLISTVSLEPEPIPADFKIIIIGDRFIYYLLSEYDFEFNDLFKVPSDFDDKIERSSENIHKFCRLITTIIKSDGLKHFTSEAVGRIIEEAARLANDSERLSLQVRVISDIAREADHFSKEGELVTRVDVEKAITARVKRNDRIRDLLLEEMVRGNILINTEGSSIGQINGISVMALGEHFFGHPSRITAKVSFGKGSVLDIEREVELGGPIHSKGVLILRGFLTSRYAKEIPLAISASLVFEQSYGGIEGDSASAAELLALLSAIAEVPIKQNFAITGSINQNGEIQAIGGVNEKIEGFFDLCKNKQLTGTQGVLIPASNVKHLMLRSDVIEAVKKGEFSIYSVLTIDDCVEILTGMKPGVRGLDGKFMANTFNSLVENKLISFAEILEKQLKQAA